MGDWEQGIITLLASGNDQAVEPVRFYIRLPQAKGMVLAAYDLKSMTGGQEVSSLKNKNDNKGVDPR